MPPKKLSLLPKERVSIWVCWKPKNKVIFFLLLLLSIRPFHYWQGRARKKGAVLIKDILSLLPPFLNFLKASSWMGVGRKDQICLPKEEEETIFCNVSWSLSCWLAVSSSPLVAVLWYYNLQFRAYQMRRERRGRVSPVRDSPTVRKCFITPAPSTFTN